MSNGKDYTKIFRDYLSVIFGTGLNKVLSFLVIMILARCLGTEGFGIFSVFFTIMMLVMQLPSVIDSTYVRYAKAEAVDEERRIECLRTAFLIKIGIFVFLAALSFFVGYILAHFCYKKPEMVFYITLAIIAGGFLSLSSTVAGVYQAGGKFIKFSVFNLLFYLGVILLIILALWLRLPVSVETATWINVLMAGAVCILGVILIYKKVKNIFPVHISTFFEMFHFSKWLLATSLAYIIFQRMDILVLAKYVDYTSLGVYSAAVRIAMLGSLFSASISVILMPKGSQALKSLGNLRSYLGESLIVLTAIVSIIGLIIIFSPFLIRILFGPQFLEAVLYTRILLAESIVTALYTPLMYLFYAENNSKAVFKIGVILLTVGICALSVLVPRYGLTGAALSIILASFCSLIFVVASSLKIIRKAYGYV